MTSAGGHPRTRDEIADQLRAAERGSAAPWFEEWRNQPPPLLMALVAAAFTYVYLDIGPVADWLIFPAIIAGPAFQVWVAWRSPTASASRMPPELRRPLWLLMASLIGVMLAVWAAADVLAPWPVVGLAGALTWSIVTWHRRLQARAVARLQDRLLAYPLPTATTRGDEGEPALLDPLLDSPARIGLMSILLASHRGVPVDFLGEHLALGESEVSALVAELEHMRYINLATNRRGGSRCTPTYPGSSATRRHRQALRQLLADQPA